MEVYHPKEYAEYREKYKFMRKEVRMQYGEGMWRVALRLNKKNLFKKILISTLKFKSSNGRLSRGPFD